MTTSDIDVKFHIDSYPYVVGIPASYFRRLTSIKESLSLSI
jgi:hypothetical protein